MVTENTTRISFRLKTDVFDLVQKVSVEAGLGPSAFYAESAGTRCLRASSAGKAKGVGQHGTALQRGARQSARGIRNRAQR